MKVTDDDTAELIFQQLIAQEQAKQANKSTNYLQYGRYGFTLLTLKNCMHMLHQSERYQEQYNKCLTLGCGLCTITFCLTEQFLCSCPFCPYKPEI